MLLNGIMVQKKQDMKVTEKPDQQTSQAGCFGDMLLKVGQQKDKESFIALFEHFAPRIKSFLMKAGLDNEIADELAQETMLTLWNKAESYNPVQAAASTWIFTIARNKRIDHLRKENRYYFESDEKIVLEDSAPSPAENMGHVEEAKAIKAALGTLPEEQSSLIKKSFFEDKSHAVIAKETGIPLGTVKSRIRLALEHLRAQTGVKELWQ